MTNLDPEQGVCTRCTPSPPGSLRCARQPPAASRQPPAACPCGPGRAGERAGALPGCAAGAGKPRDPLAQAERRRKAVELRRGGATYDEIAFELGLANRGNAFRLVQRAVLDHTREPTEQLVALEAVRLDALQLALWPRAMRGAPAAGAQVLRVMERRARLLGLDAKARTEVAVSAVRSDLDAEIEQLVAGLRNHAADQPPPAEP